MAWRVSIASSSANTFRPRRLWWEGWEDPSQSLLHQRILSGRKVSFYGRLSPWFRLNRFFISEYFPAEQEKPPCKIMEPSQSLLHQRILSGMAKDYAAAHGFPSQSLLHQRILSGLSSKRPSLSCNPSQSLLH